MHRRSGSPEWIEDSLLGELDGGLWHATDERGWFGIVADGSIRADAVAKYGNGFCRSIGAVSLFDLSRPESAVSPTASHWSDWLRPNAGKCIWIEVDREASAGKLLDPDATLARWKLALEEGCQNLRYIAGIEAAHIGALPLTSTLRALEIGPEPDSDTGHRTILRQWRWRSTKARKLSTTTSVHLPTFTISNSPSATSI
jgi:hypothetical protein